MRFDYFGHGQSDGDFLDGTIGRWKEDTLAMLREVCGPAPQIVVGSSMGGWLATLAALALPDRTAGLVLIAPALDFTEDLIWADMTEAQRAVLLRDGILREPSQYSDQPYEYTLKLITEGREHMILKPGIVYDKPVRILQGMMDPDVPYGHAVKTAAALGRRYASDAAARRRSPPVAAAGYRIADQHRAQLDMSILETARVRLRPLRVTDAPAVSAMMTPNVSRWVATLPSPFSVEAAAERLTRAIAGNDAGTAFSRIAERKSDKAAMGWLGIAVIDEAARIGSMGYWLGEAYHGCAI